MGAANSGAAKPAVAVLGTGRMGTPIARNLLAAGFRVSVWNRTAARAQPLVADGAQLGRTPAEAAKSADVALTMLADGDAVLHAMTGADGAAAALAPGAVWIQMATVGVDWTERLAAVAAEHELVFVDAPVSGSDGPAREGVLVVLASGPDNARERLQPIFDVIGSKTLWLGPAGGGSRLKLALNAWLASLTEAAAEAVALAEALGIDPRVFIDTIADGPLGSPYAVAKANAMLEQKFDPGFALRHAHKDVELALAAAREHGVELPLAEALAQRWEQAVADGHGDEDIAAVITEAHGPPTSASTSA